MSLRTSLTATEPRRPSGDSADASAGGWLPQPLATYRVVVRSRTGNAFACCTCKSWDEALALAMQWAVDGIRTEVTHG